MSEADQAHAALLTNLNQMFAQLTAVQQTQAQAADRAATAALASASNSVDNACKNLIVPFKKDNVTNFLASVESVCNKYGDDEARVVQVLNYAKLRVDSDPIIEKTNFATFAAFKSTLTQKFLQTKSHTQLMAQLLLTTQGADEKTKAYADKMEALKCDYIKALGTEYDISVDRMAEAERTATRSFMTGLRDDILKYIKSEPTDFSSAVARAMEGEQANDLKKRATQIITASEAAVKKPANFTSFRGNPRQNYQMRGGYNRGYNRGAYRGYQGGNYNRSGGYQGQSGALANNNQQQDDKQQRNGGGPDGVGSNNTNTNANTRPRGNGNFQGNRGGCFVCGDVRHRAADCRQRIPQAASVEQVYDEREYYDDYSYDQYEQDSWRSAGNASKNEEEPPQGSSCSAAAAQLALARSTQ